MKQYINLQRNDGTAEPKAELMLAVQDASAFDMVTLLNKAMESVTKIQDTPFKTSGEFGDGFANIKDSNAHTIPLENLIRMYGAVTSRAKAFNDATDELRATGVLGTTSPAFNIEGYSEEDWKHDIGLRIQINMQKETVETYAALKKEAEELMDKKDREKILAGKIAALTGKVPVQES